MCCARGHPRALLVLLMKHAGCPFLFRRLTLCSIAALLECSNISEAVIISSGPSFTKATNAPLAGVLQLTTDVPSRVGVSVSDGTETWERNFYDFSTTQSVPLFGFKPGRTNKITVTVYDRLRNKFTAAAPVQFITDPLPADFPVINVLTSKPEQMEPGYTLFRGANNNQKVGYVTFVDNAGPSGLVQFQSPIVPRCATIG